MKTRSQLMRLLFVIWLVAAMSPVIVTRHASVTSWAEPMKVHYVPGDWTDPIERSITPNDWTDPIE